MGRNKDGGRTCGVAIASATDYVLDQLPTETCDDKFGGAALHFIECVVPAVAATDGFFGEGEQYFPSAIGGDTGGSESHACCTHAELLYTNPLLWAQC
jgi:hypothetical protein